MPVAVHKRSWEDHVIPRTGLQYSYDDLDLVFCHVRYQRGRCASMPECGHHQPWTLPCPENGSGDGMKRMEKIVQKFQGGSQLNCDGAKGRTLMPGDTVNETAQHKSDQDSRLPSDNSADQDELQCSTLGNLQAHNGDPDNKELNKDKVSSPHSLTHSLPTTTSLDQTEGMNDLSSELKNGISLNNSVKADCSELTSTKSGTSVENIESLVKVTVSSQMLLDHKSVISGITDISNKPPTSDSQQKSADPHIIVEGQCCEMSEQTILTSGKVECSCTDETMIPNFLSSSTSQETHHIPEASLDANKASLVCKHHMVTQSLQDYENQGDGILKCPDHGVLNDGNFKTPACESFQLEPSGKTDTMETWIDCSSKLQTIHEGSFPESGDDTSPQISAEMLEHLTDSNTNYCENLSNSEDQNSRLKETTRGDLQPEGLYEKLQKNPITNSAKEPEIVPKAESSLVKLRAKKVRCFTCCCCCCCF